MPEVAAARRGGGRQRLPPVPLQARLLLAALVIERLEEVREDAETAVLSPAGPWAALVALLRDYAERQAGDDVVRARPRPASRPSPTSPAPTRRRPRPGSACSTAARAEGRLRPDASTDDIRLIFAAMRAASQVEQGAWRRMLELSIDALAAA